MIRPYAADDAPACAQLWGRVQSRTPTFVPVDAPSLHAAIASPASAHDEVAEAAALVAADGRGLQGWAALCRRRPGPDAPWTAVLRALCVPAGDTDAVGALMAAARGWAGGARLVIGGSGGLRFQNGGDGALPESCGLAPTLLRCGMRLTSRGLVLQGAVEAVPAPAGPAEMEAADDIGSCRARVAGRTVGECWVDAAAEYSSHPEAAAHAFVQWIGTEAGWRGRGVARQMWAFACVQLHRCGVRRISLCTPCDNFAAQAFYFRAGLRVVDHGLGLEMP